MELYLHNVPLSTQPSDCTLRLSMGGHNAEIPWPASSPADNAPDSLDTQLMLALDSCPTSGDLIVQNVSWTKDTRVSYWWPRRYVGATLFPDDVATVELSVRACGDTEMLGCQGGEPLSWTVQFLQFCTWAALLLISVVVLATATVRARRWRRKHAVGPPPSQQPHIRYLSGFVVLALLGVIVLAWYIVALYKAHYGTLDVRQPAHVLDVLFAYRVPSLVATLLYCVLLWTVLIVPEGYVMDASQSLRGVACGSSKGTTVLMLLVTLVTSVVAALRPASDTSFMAAGDGTSLAADVTSATSLHLTSVSLTIPRAWWSIPTGAEPATSTGSTRRFISESPSSWPYIISYSERLGGFAWVSATVSTTMPTVALLLCAVLLLLARRAVAQLQHRLSQSSLLHSAARADAIWRALHNALREPVMLAPARGYTDMPRIVLPAKRPILHLPPPLTARDIPDHMLAQWVPAMRLILLGLAGMCALAGAAWAWEPARNVLTASGGWPLLGAAALCIGLMMMAALWPWTFDAPPRLAAGLASWRQAQQSVSRVLPLVGQQVSPTIAVLLGAVRAVGGSSAALLPSELAAIRPVASASPWAVVHEAQRGAEQSVWQSVASRRMLALLDAAAYRLLPGRLSRASQLLSSSAAGVDVLSAASPPTRFRSLSAPPVPQSQAMVYHSHSEQSGVHNPHASLNPATVTPRVERPPSDQPISMCWHDGSTIQWSRSGNMPATGMHVPARAVLQHVQGVQSVLSLAYLATAAPSVVPDSTASADLAAWLFQVCNKRELGSGHASGIALSPSTERRRTGHMRASSGGSITRPPKVQRGTGDLLIDSVLHADGGQSTDALCQVLQARTRRQRARLSCASGIGMPTQESQGGYGSQSACSQLAPPDVPRIARVSAPGSLVLPLSSSEGPGVAVDPSLSALFDTSARTPIPLQVARGIRAVLDAALPAFHKVNWTLHHTILQHCVVLRPAALLHIAGSHSTTLGLRGCRPSVCLGARHVIVDPARMARAVVARPQHLLAEVALFRDAHALAMCDINRLRRMHIRALNAKQSKTHASAHTMLGEANDVARPHSPSHGSMREPGPSRMPSMSHSSYTRRDHDTYRDSAPGMPRGVSSTMSGGSLFSTGSAVSLLHSVSARDRSRADEDGPQAWRNLLSPAPGPVSDARQAALANAVHHWRAGSEGSQASDMVQYWSGVAARRRFSKQHLTGRSGSRLVSGDSTISAGMYSLLSSAYSAAKLSTRGFSTGTRSMRSTMSSVPSGHSERDASTHSGAPSSGFHTPIAAAPRRASTVRSRTAESTSTRSTVDVASPGFVLQLDDSMGRK